MKAEVFSSDFIIGLFLFLIAIVMFEMFYTNLSAEIGDYKIRSDLHSKANSISETLVTSPGFPEDWNSSNVEIIGLFDSGLVNLTKFDRMKELEYYAMKNKLGLGGYNLYVHITNSTGSALNDYAYGIKEDGNAEQVFYVKRLCLINYSGNITKAILNVGVWS